MTEPKPGSYYEGLPETHVEKMDRIELEHKQKLELEKVKQEQETKREKVKRSAARQDTYQIVGIGILVAAVVITIILALWNPWDTTPKPDNELVREQNCVAAGGGWVPKDLFVNSSGRGMCVFPGKSVPVPADE